MFATTTIIQSENGLGVCSTTHDDEKPNKTVRAQTSWTIVNNVASVGIAMCNKQLFSDQRIRNMMFSFVSYQLMCTALTITLMSRCVLRRPSTTRGWIILSLCIIFCMLAVTTVSLIVMVSIAVFFDNYPSTLGQVISLPWANISFIGVLVSASMLSHFETTTHSERHTKTLGVVKVCTVIAFGWLSNEINSFLSFIGALMLIGCFNGYCSVLIKGPSYRQVPSFFKPLCAILFLWSLLFIPIVVVGMLYDGSASLFPSETSSSSKHQCYLDPRTHNTSYFTSEQAAENVFQTCETVKPSSCKEVPNIVHLVFIGGQMKFYHYASIKSMREVLQPEAIFVHGYDNANPNDNFKRAMDEFNLTLIESRVPTYVFDRKVDSIEHRTDVLRIETLINYGGMYFDLDVFILQPMTELRKYESVMGPETPLNFWKPNHLASNILMSKRCSAFMLAWYDNYRTFDDSDWAGHAIYLPGRLFFENARNLHVEPRISTNYDESFDFYKTPAIRKDWSKIFCVHLCIRGHDEPTEQNYRWINTEFGNLIRHVMDGDTLDSSSNCKNDDNILAAPFYIVDSHSGYAFDVSEGSCVDGTRILLYPFHGGENQMFRRGPTEKHTIMSVQCNNNMVMEIAESSDCDDGSQLQLHGFTGGSHQNFQMSSSGSIIHAKCNKVLGVDNNNTDTDTDNNHLVLRDAVDGNNTLKDYWITTSAPYFWLVNPATGKTLDVAEGSCREGTDIIPWEFHGERNQQFRLDASGNLVHPACSSLVVGTANCEDGSALQLVSLSSSSSNLARGVEIQSDGTLLSKRCNKVVDISLNHQHGAVLRNKSTGEPGQQWRLRFAI